MPKGKGCKSHGKPPDPNRLGALTALAMAGFRIVIPDRGNMPDRRKLRHPEIEWFFRTTEARGMNNTFELLLAKRKVWPFDFKPVMLAFGIWSDVSDSINVGANHLGPCDSGRISRHP